MSSLKELLTNRYTLERTIGKGAFSEVYLARDIQNERDCALKVMDLTRIPPNERGFHYDLFLRESQMLQHLDHPGIPEFFDFFIQDDMMILSMEYVPGLDLDAFMRENGAPLEELEVLDIFIQVCQILEYLHEEDKGQMVIYRDLKPANILIDENGKVKLIDFATARIYDPAKKSDTIRLGTPGYAAPEAYGSGQTDRRADVFSVGASMFHLLTGEDPEKYMFQYPPLRKINPRLSVYIQDIVTETLKPRDRRTPDVTILKDRLKNLRDTLGFMKEFSPGSIFFRFMFSIIQFFRMKFSFRPSRDFVRVGIILFTLCIITPALVVFLSLKFPSRSVRFVFQDNDTVHQKLYGDLRKRRLEGIINNMFENYKSYCELGRYEEAMQEWKDFISFSSPYPEVMKSKFRLYPQAMKSIAPSGRPEYTSDVFNDIMGEYERYMNGDLLGDPTEDLKEITVILSGDLSADDLAGLIRNYARTTPMTSYSRKVFIIQRMATALEDRGQKEEAAMALAVLLEALEQIEKGKGKGDLIRQRFDLRYDISPDIIFIKGETARIRGDEVQARSFYRAYLEKTQKSAGIKGESYRESFREKLFKKDALRHVEESGKSVMDKNGKDKKTGMNPGFS